ncbi:hypothetical protein POTOM_046300 [Populus tomentosa]|uniref:BZIP domain-containing protein n=1 Tax=Populus tomentosa TaxID=118781 RepID=A0A8X8CCJ5_POPTO|nr:hypothetical protein POTOM_046300 [Populus tomentosa]
MDSASLLCQSLLLPNDISTPQNSSSSTDLTESQWQYPVVESQTIPEINADNGFAHNIISPDISLSQGCQESHGSAQEIPPLIISNQNDQAAQPSAANQNNQLVQLSADKNKKEKKREADKKYRDGKKKQNETLIADKAKLKRKLASTKAKFKRKLASTKAKFKRKLASMKARLASMKASLASTKASLAYKNGKLDQLKEDMEQTRETCRIQKQMVETQYIMINMLQQHLPFEIPQFNTGEIGLPVNHPPANQPGLSTIEELLEQCQLLLPQDGAHGNNVEQPAFNYGGYLSGSPDHLNNSTYPPGTGTGDNVEQSACAYGGDLPGSLII